MGFYDDIEKQMKRQGIGLQFRDSVYRWQRIRTRTEGAGLSEADLVALDELTWIKLQKLDHHFDALDFLDKKMADYITRGVTPQPQRPTEPPNQ